MKTRNNGEYVQGFYKSLNGAHNVEALRTPRETRSRIGAVPVKELNSFISQLNYW